MIHTLAKSRLFQHSRDFCNRQHVYNLHKYTLTCLVCLLLVSQPSKAQQDGKPRPVTQQEARTQQPDAKRLKAGYQTQVPGWILFAGDTLQLGQGSREDKGFVYIHTLSASDDADAQKSLNHTYSGQKVVLKELIARGSAENGFGVYGVISPGTLPPYYIALDSAVNAGELLPPIKYRPSAAASPALPAKIAQELIKLKAALDAGTLTQQEYESRRRKLLN